MYGIRGLAGLLLCLTLGAAALAAPKDLVVIPQSAQATLVHHESYTRGASQIDPHPQDTAEFRRRWSAFLKAGDPFYNPGLSTNSTGWDIRDPLPYGFELVRRVYDRDARREADAQARETIRLRVVA